MPSIISVLTHKPRPVPLTPLVVQKGWKIWLITAADMPAPLFVAYAKQAGRQTPGLPRVTGQPTGPNRQVQTGSRPRQFEDRDIRMPLYLFEHCLLPVRGNVKVADLKVSRYIGQLPLGVLACINQPQVLMLDAAT